MRQRDLRLIRHKLPRALAFARANHLDRVAFGSHSGRLVIATAGKAYPDVLAALRLLGISEDIARAAGIGALSVQVPLGATCAGAFWENAKAAPRSIVNGTLNRHIICLSACVVPSPRERPASTP